MFRAGLGAPLDKALPAQTTVCIEGRSSARLAAIGRAAIEYTFVAIFCIIAGAMTVAWTAFLGFVVLRAGQWALG